MPWASRLRGAGVWALAILAASRALVLVRIGVRRRGCGATLIVSSLRAGRYRDAVVWSAIGIGWLASFVACYRASAAAQPVHDDVYLLGFRFPAGLAAANLGRARLADARESCSRSSSIP